MQNILFTVLDLIDDRQTLSFALITATFLAPVVATVAGFIA